MLLKRKLAKQIVTIPNGSPSQQHHSYDILIHYDVDSDESFVHQSLTPGLEDEALEEASDHAGSSLLAKRTVSYYQVWPLTQYIVLTFV